MGSLVVGDIVVVPFPFSDLSKQKRRPAVVVAPSELGDVILCQLTSRKLSETRIEIRDEDLASGTLRHTSYARPDKLFTASESLVLYTAGTLAPAKRTEIRAAVAALFS